MFQKIYQQAAPLVFKVELLEGGEPCGNGTAFHIGGGYMVTAKHVVERVKEGHHTIGAISNGYYEELRQPQPNESQSKEGASVLPKITCNGEWFPDQVLEEQQFERERYDALIQSDIAILKTNLDAQTFMTALLKRKAKPWETALILAPMSNLTVTPRSVGKPVVCIGYPRIYGTKDCTTAYCYPSHIAALGTSPHDSLKRFTIHGPALGGLSGGPVLIDGQDEYGPRVLGMITECAHDAGSGQVGEDGQMPSDWGFLSAISLTVAELMSCKLKVPSPFQDIGMLNA